TIAGPYGQDPVAAAHVARRLPGLRLALEGLRTAGDDRRTAGAWMTLARRERNRVSDALLGASDALRPAGVPGRDSNPHPDEDARAGGPGDDRPVAVMTNRKGGDHAGA